MDVRHVMKVDDFLNTASKYISFGAVNPLRLPILKREFFRNFKNPHFIYAPGYYRLDFIEEILEKIKLGNGPIEDMLEDKRLELINKIQMIKTRGTEEFTKSVIKVYGKPDKALIKQAKEILRQRPDKTKAKIPISKTIMMLKRAISDYHFEWDVRKKDLPVSIDVDHMNKTIFVRLKQRFSERYIKRLIVHEIGTHVLRAENAALQPYKIFYYGTANYLKTEEGLAVYNEEKLGVLDTNALRNYAGRVIAVDLALKNSFYETYKELSRYFPNATAYKLAIRAKRGIGDSTEPGGCTKDIVYLKGYNEVKEYVEKGGNINNLYYGKIALEYVDKLSMIQGMVKPKYSINDLKILKN